MSALRQDFRDWQERERTFSFVVLADMALGLILVVARASAGRWGDRLHLPRHHVPVGLVRGRSVRGVARAEEPDHVHQLHVRPVPHRRRPMSALGLGLGIGLLAAVALAFAVLGAFERWTR